MMKKLMNILLALGFALTTQAENAVTFLDRNLEETTAEHAMYQRTSNLLDDGHYHVKVSFLDGQTRMIGRYTDQHLDTEEGWFVYYFASGNRESQGHYHKGQRVGTWNRWDWQGNALSDRFYSDNAAATGTTCDASIGEGENAMSAYIGTHLNYPENARVHGIEGKVRLAFNVNAEGAVEDVEVTYSAHPFLTTAALEFVANMPAWTPAMQNGVAYASQHTLPLTFMLTAPSE